MTLARKAHANLLAGADCPEKGPLKAVLQALAGDDASEADTASQAEESTEAVEALCDKLAADALGRVQSMLLTAVRAKYSSEKDRMIEMALQAVAEEG
jgi:Tfp pilus assembly protein PilX